MLERARARNVAWTLLQAFALGLVLAACKKEAQPTPAGASSAAASAPAASARAAGTGASLQDARALPQGSLTFTVPCSGAAYVGPFHFTSDPEKLTLESTAKSLSGKQVCASASWVDGADAFVEATGLGCPEGAQSALKTLTFEHSPGSGGNRANPVYLRVAFDQPQTAGCDTAEVTLTRK